MTAPKKTPNQNDNQAPTPGALRLKLLDLEKALAGLNSEIEETAFRMQANEAGAEDAFHDLTKRALVIQGQIDALKRALPAAERHQAKERSLAQLKAAHSQIAATTVHATARTKEVETLVGILHEAVASWRKIMQHSEAMSNSAPTTVGGKPLNFTHLAPPALIDPNAIRSAIASELYRISMDPSLVNHVTFPGAKAPSLDLSTRPQAIIPLTVAFEEATQFFLKTIRGEVQEEKVNLRFPKDMNTERASVTGGIVIAQDPGPGFPSSPNTLPPSDPTKPVADWVS